MQITMTSALTPLALVAAFALPAAAQERGPAGSRVGGSTPVKITTAPTTGPGVQRAPLQRGAGTDGVQQGGTTSGGGSQSGTGRPTATPAAVQRIRHQFASADTNDDSFVTMREALASGLDRPGFTSFDFSGDKRVSQEEFIVGMRELMVEAGRPVDPELQAEATRIQALRRARAAQEQRTGGPASRRGGIERPGAETRGAETTGAERPAGAEAGRVGQRPAVERPTSGARGASPLPGVQRPAAQRPAAQRPAAQRPAAQRPNAQRPAVPRRPAVQRPGAQRPTSQRPAAQRPSRPRESGRG